MSVSRHCCIYYIHLRVFVADGLEEHLKVGSTKVSLALESSEQTVASHVLEVFLTDVLQQHITLSQMYCNNTSLYHRCTATTHHSITDVLQQTNHNKHFTLSSLYCNKMLHSIIDVSQQNASFYHRCTATTCITL